MSIAIRHLELRVRPEHAPWNAHQRWDTVDFVLDGQDLQDWLSPLAPQEHREAGD